MNSKKTNYLNIICNFITVITVIAFITIIENIGKISSFLNNSFMDFCYRNDKIMLFIIIIPSIIFNIISMIQNIKNKKILFWKIIYVVCMISILICTCVYNGITEVIERIAFSVIPLIIAIINLILIKKNKPKKIQIVSYILIIVFSIAVFFKDFIVEAIFDRFIIWDDATIMIEYLFEIFVYSIIALIMQIIYFKKQNENNENVSSKGKILNIILFYVLHSLITIGLFFAIFFIIISSSINLSKLKNEVDSVVNTIIEHKSYTKNGIVEVELDSKYGLINTSGEEILKPEYDAVYVKVSYFNNKEYKYYVVKKDNNFSIILTDNTVIDLNEKSSYYKNLYNESLKGFNDSENSLLMLCSYYYLGKGSNKDEYYLKDTEGNSNENILEEKESDDDNDVFELENGIKMYVESSEDEFDTYKVTVKEGKNIISEEDNIIIPFNYGDIQLYSNDGIPFCNLKKETQGWYDIKTGKTHMMNGKFRILDVTDKVMIIKEYNTKDRLEYLFDYKNNKTLITAYYIEKTKGGFIIHDMDHKEFFVNDDLTAKSASYNYVLEVTEKDNVSSYVGVTKTKNGLKCILFDENGKIVTKKEYSKIGNSVDWDFLNEEDYYEYNDEDDIDRYFFGQEYEDKYSNSYIDEDDDDEDTNLNNNSNIDYSKINLNGNNNYSSNNYKFSDLNNSNIKLNKVNDIIDISNMEYSIPKDYIEGYSSDYMYEYGRKIEDISENQDMVELSCFFKRELTDEENLYLNEYIRFESSDSDVLDNIVNTEIINKDGVNWFKAKIDLTSSKQKIVYIYATQIDDMIFNYMYEDYDNNNEDVVNQIFDSIKLK